MADTAASTHSDPSAQLLQDSAGAGRSWTAILLLLLAAGIAWVVSIPLNAREPFAPVDTFETWFAFGRRILADVFRLLSIITLAVAVAGLFPRLGLWIEWLIFRSSRRWFLATTAFLAFLSAALFSYFVFAHFAWIQDEIAMLFQAEVFARGRLYADTPRVVDFFDWEFIVVDGPRWYGKYFFGPSLIFVPGVMLGVPWLVNPILAAAAVWVTFALGRDLFNEKIARIAVVLMVVSPLRVSLFSMMMAHPVCLVALGIFLLGLIKVVQDPRRAGWALAAGAALGFAVNCRPLTAVAMGGVAGVITMFVLPWRQLRVRTAVAFLLPLVVFAGLFLAYNQALTGDPFLTPFAKWSPKDRLGFGRDIGLENWPEIERYHSLRKALFYNGYFHLDALGSNLTGWGHATLLLLVLPLFRSPWPKRTWAIAAVTAGLAIAYGFYLTHSVIAGQTRYWSEAMPLMLLLVAISTIALRRRLPALCRWFGLTPSAPTGRAACWIALLLLSLWTFPRGYWPIIANCSLDFFGQGKLLRVRDMAETHDLDNALVLVQTHNYRDYARMRLYDKYGSAFQLNDPLLEGPVLYARDLGERNGELVAAFPDRRVYRFIEGDYEGEDQLVELSRETLDPVEDAPMPGASSAEASPGTAPVP